ncbi:MAG: polysaccharide deacetylase family protein, partial [Pseudonocardiaceae bacterium]
MAFSPRGRSFASQRRGLLCALLALALLAGVGTIAGCGSGGSALLSEEPVTVTVPTGLPDPAWATLRNDSFTSIRDGLSRNVQRLRSPRVTHDLDEDGHIDSVAFVRTEVSLAPTQAKSPRSLAGRPSPPLPDAVDFLSLVATHSSGGKSASSVLPLGPGAQPDGLRLEYAQLRRGAPHRIIPRRVAVSYFASDPHRPEMLQRRSFESLLTNSGFKLLGDIETEPEPNGNAPEPQTLTLGRERPDDPAPQSGTGTSIRSGALAYGANEQYSVDIAQGRRVDIDATGTDLRLGVSGADGTVLLDPGRSQHRFAGRAPKTQKYRITVSSSENTPTRYDLKTTVTKPPPVNRKVPGRATEGKVLHLTFDDGPSQKYTAAVLDLLAKYHAMAT